MPEVLRSSEDTQKIVEWLLGVMLQSPNASQCAKKLESVLASNLTKLFRIYCSPNYSPDTIPNMTTFSAARAGTTTNAGTHNNPQIDERSSWNTGTLRGSGGTSITSVTEIDVVTDTAGIGDLPSRSPSPPHLTSLASIPDAKSFTHPGIGSVPFPLNQTAAGESETNDTPCVGLTPITVSLLDLSILPTLVPTSSMDTDYMAAKLGLDPVVCAERLSTLQLHPMTRKPVASKIPGATTGTSTTTYMFRGHQQ